MTLKIGSNIKALRTKRGITQEKLAEYLGISCQAISKWESESGYPDIELIPALAYYFNVSTDELLGVDISGSKDVIDGYISRYFALSSDLSAQLALIREATARFPNNYSLLQCLMYALSFNIEIHMKTKADSGMMTKATALEEKANKELLNEVITIAERILRDCLEDRVRYSAIQVLCYYYPMLNKKENAVLLACSMPPLYISRDFLLEEIYTGEEKILQIQKNIGQMTDYLCCNILSVADPDSQQQNNISVDEKIHLIETANRIYQLIDEEGDSELFHCRLAHNYRLMAALFLLEDYYDDAMTCLEKAADHAIASDTAPATSAFTSRAVNRLTNAMPVDDPEGDSMSKLNYIFYQNSVDNRIVLKIENFEGNQSGLLLKKLEQQRYDRIRNTDRFIFVTGKLKQHK